MRMMQCAAMPPMIAAVVIAVLLAPAGALAADTKSGTSGGAAPARSAVDPAMAAEHTKEDVRRHRQIAAAHEAAAKCQEAGTDEDICNAALAKACKGIAYGKYCGMKHPD
jgi:hypothetical protein